MKKRIAIQGYEGSFHHEAARIFYGDDVTVVPCDTFRQTFKIAGEKTHSDGGIVAIENSIAGSILQNYNLLQKHSLWVSGEIYLHIRQHLLVNHGVQIEDIHEVQSHPMALLQCTDFLEKHAWKLIETDDTALSARHIKQHHLKKTAVIAGKMAAELYDLTVLAPNIHTIKPNYTRFLALSNKPQQIPVDANKASLYFQTHHKIGSLAQVLTIISKEGVNLSKLQSFPIPGSDWKYFFHVDMEFESLAQYERVMKAIKPKTQQLQVYGIYKKGMTTTR